MVCVWITHLTTKNNYMNIALCLSGQPRYVKKCHPSIYSNIIEKYNPKIFVHSWFDKNLVGKTFDYSMQYSGRNEEIRFECINEIVELYSPDRIFLQKPMEFDMSPFKEKNFELMTRPSNMMSFLYSLNKSNELKIEYEKEMGIIFDIVIRCRFDVNIKTFTINESIDQKSIFGQAAGEDLLNDQIFYSSSSTMDNISKLFSMAPLYTENKNQPHSYVPERLLDYHYNLFGIKKIIEPADRLNSNLTLF